MARKKTEDGAEKPQESSVSPLSQHFPVPPLAVAGTVPVGYAIDPKRHLSATPLTPIGAVAGVADRPRNLSLA
jgi:hypothetical protein